MLNSKSNKGFTLIEVLVAIVVIAIIGALVCSKAHGMSGMGNETLPPASSGVVKANAEVVTQSNGLTVEQENVKKRIEMENQPGSIKHLYIISAYSGQVILYSTVKGKVTSSGKRLSPSSHSENGCGGEYSIHSYTPENLGDDGTYGPSIEYLYWWDVKGIYHQQYVTGGMILHVADQPMQFGRVTLQTESDK